MTNCGRCNVRKHREIKGSDNYVTLNISLKFDSLDKIKITSSKSWNNLVRPLKGLIASLSLKAKARPNKYKKAKYAIKIFSKKDLSQIIRDFEELPYEIYERKRPKQEPTGSYSYLSRQIVNGMMRAYVLNLHVYPVRK